jgi:hypothetical protein
MRFDKRASLLVASLLTLLWAAGVSATPLIGDQTTIEITGDFGDLDIVLSQGSFSDALGNAVFPIVGGDVSIPLLEGVALHDGGVGFERDGVRVGIEAFALDFTNGVLTGFLGLLVDGAPRFGGEVALFDVRSCLTSTASDPCLDGDGSLLLNGFGLDLTDTLAMFLNDAFGTGFAGGDPFGVATVDLRFAEVPEPGLGWLLGLAAACVLARRARA